FSGRSGFLHPDRRLDPPVYTILKRRAGRRVAAPSTARRSGRVGRRVSTATSGGWREGGQLRTQAREHFSNAADGELRDRRRRHVLRLRADAVRLVDEHVAALRNQHRCTTARRLGEFLEQGIDRYLGDRRVLDGTSNHTTSGEVEA